MGEVTGQDIFELARDKIVSLVTALIATQVSNADDPAIGYVYENHGDAKEKAKKLQNHIATYYTWNRAVERVYERLQQIGG